MTSGECEPAATDGGAPRGALHSPRRNHGVDFALTAWSPSALNRAPMAGDPPAPAHPAVDRRFAGLALAALGVVFGDIGTSPLYALHVCFTADGGLAPSAANVLGVLSLVFWALIIVVSVKYVAFVMRADLNGEGGILALMALATRAGTATPRRRQALIALGLFGAALLYGDGMLTPAISVLSAVEGLREATPVMTDAIELIAVAVLVAFFWFQRRGTARVGAVFGPVMLLWFAALAALGLRWIAAAPEVVAAVAPQHALRFLFDGGVARVWVLGSVFLVVTGGEALYADIGHFGTAPIRFMWFAVVLPAVLINYFGQGAMLLRQPGAVHHTFYQMAPQWALYPLIALATAAAIIASQAIIAGAFSLTSQALQLGFTPRIEIRHSSAEEEGQVYVPLVNWLLFAAAVALVLQFRTSSALANAYGVAVSGTMVLTTMLSCVYFRSRWGLLAAAAMLAAFLPIDSVFLIANLTKIGRGGWFPLCVGALGYLIFTTWMRGQHLLAAELSRTVRTQFAQALGDGVQHVPGSAVYLTRSPLGIPRHLLQNVAHNHVMHRNIVLLTITTDPVPRVARERRLEVLPADSGFHRVVGHYGYMQRPNVPQLVRDAAAQGVAVDPAAATYFLARARVIATPRPGMARWRKHLYALLAGTARAATSNYRIPPDQAFEIGLQVEI
jgi:KUP system potassium uptake protein